MMNPTFTYHARAVTNTPWFLMVDIASVDPVLGMEHPNGQFMVMFYPDQDMAVAIPDGYGLAA